VGSGVNLIAQSQNGSGKTAAFALGMLSRVDRSLKKPQALCLAPTRELALQIKDNTTDLGQFTDIRIVACVPGEKPRMYSIAGFVLLRGEI
jgi:ATP-dependent RNA helicase DDX19/DBP5